MYAANSSRQLSRGDIYRLQALQRIQQMQAEEEARALQQANSQSQGGISDIADMIKGAGAVEGGKEIATTIGGGSSALSGAGAMSVQPGLDLATVKSLSTGGSGLMTSAPAQVQTLNVAPQAAGTFDLAGIGSSGNAILPVAGAVGMYDLFKNNRRGGRGLAQGAASGAAMGSYFGPWGAGIGAVLGGGASLLNKESTREGSKRRTKDLYKNAGNDQVALNYIKGMRDQYESAPPDPSKPFAGKYGSWDEYKKAGLEASDLTGVYGNLKTFGNDWAKLSQDQRQKVTQGIIDAGLYNSKKGEVEITDPNKALSIRDSILNPKVSQPTKTNNIAEVIKSNPKIQQIEKALSQGKLPTKSRI